MTRAQSHSHAYILPLARLKAGGKNPNSAPVSEEVPWVMAMAKTQCSGATSMYGKMDEI